LLYTKNASKNHDINFLFPAEVFSECIELTRFGVQQKEVALLDDIIDDVDLKALDRARCVRLAKRNIVEKIYLEVFPK
jgi:hypothetical protein